MAEINTTSVEWDLRFLELAKLVSTWSKDPSTKVGAVIIDDNRRVVSVGYNGFPKGVRDSEHRLGNREVKYNYMVHAERNAMLFANSIPKNSTIYTYPFCPDRDWETHCIQQKQLFCYRQ